VRLERLAVGRIDAALDGGQEGAAPVGIFGADLKAGRLTGGNQKLDNLLSVVKIFATFY
jgi:hypothetical protein